jgi:hypothetical protein
MAPVGISLTPSAYLWSWSAYPEAGQCPLRAAVLEAAKGFRRLEVHKQLPMLRETLGAMRQQNDSATALAPNAATA